MRLRWLLLGLGLMACASEAIAQRPPEPVRVPYFPPTPTPPPEGLEPVAEPTMEAIFAARGNLARWRDEQRAQFGPVQALPAVPGYFAFFRDTPEDTVVQIATAMWEDAFSGFGAASTLALAPVGDCGTVEGEIADVAYLGGLELEPIYKPLGYSLRPASAGPPVLGIPDLLWLQPPMAGQILKTFPARALRKGRSGRVAMRCTITAGPLDCQIADEEPTGWGFGAAGLQAASEVAVAPQLPDGSSALGRELCFRVRYALG